MVYNGNQINHAWLISFRNVYKLFEDILFTNNNLLLAYSHVAHDCEIADNVVLTNQAALAGAVKVGEGAILGGYAIVHQYCSWTQYVLGIIAHMFMNEWTYQWTLY